MWRMRRRKVILMILTMMTMIAVDYEGFCVNLNLKTRHGHRQAVQQEGRQGWWRIKFAFAFVFVFLLYLCLCFFLYLYLCFFLYLYLCFFLYLYLCFFLYFEFSDSAAWQAVQQEFRQGWWRQAQYLWFFLYLYLCLNLSFYLLFFLYFVFSNSCG